MGGSTGALWTQGGSKLRRQPPESANLVDVVLPMATVEDLQAEPCTDGDIIKAAKIDAHAVGMGPGGVEGLDATPPTKGVSGDARVESIGDQFRLTTEESKSIPRHDEMLETAHVAD